MVDDEHSGQLDDHIEDRIGGHQQPGTTVHPCRLKLRVWWCATLPGLGQGMPRLTQLLPDEILENFWTKNVFENKNIIVGAGGWVRVSLFWMFTTQRVHFEGAGVKVCQKWIFFSFVSRIFGRIFILNLSLSLYKCWGCCDLLRSTNFLGMSGKAWDRGCQLQRRRGSNRVTSTIYCTGEIGSNQMRTVRQRFWFWRDAHFFPVSDRYYRFVKFFWVIKCYQIVEFWGRNCLELLNLGSYFSLEGF